jgi:hypothetical protein
MPARMPAASVTASRLFGGVGVDGVAEDFQLVGLVGVAHGEAHQKAVLLRFRQGEGAVVLVGVLRGDYEKRAAEAAAWPGRW